MQRVQGATKSAERVANKAFKAIGVGIAGAAGAYALMAKQALESGDKIHKLNLRLGLSTEYLSQLKHASDLSGISLNTTAKSVQKMQENISDAANGIGTAKDSLDELGLSSDGLKQLAPEDQLLAIAKGMESISNKGDRTRIAADIFGGRGVEMLQLLSGGAAGLKQMTNEADSLGLTLSQDGANAIAKFNDDMTRMKARIFGVVQTSVVQLGPTLSSMTDWFGKYIPQAINYTVKGFQAIPGVVAIITSTVTKGLIKFYDLLGAIPGRIGQPYRDAAANLREFTTELDNFAAASIAAMETSEDFSVKAGAMPKPIVDTASAITDEVTKEKTDKEIDAIYEQNADKLTAHQEFNNALYTMNAISAADEIAIAKAVADEKEKLEKQKFKAVQFSTNNMIKTGKLLLTSVAKDNRAVFEATKALSIGQAIMTAYAGANQALGSLPYPANIIAAASVVAFGLANVASIASQSMDGTGGGASAGVPAVSATTAPIVDTTAPGYGAGDVESGRTLTINIHGDLIGDEQYVDNLVDKINEAEDRDVFINQTNYAGALA